jgi:hypothetical protein
MTTDRTTKEIDYPSEKNPTMSIRVPNDWIRIDPPAGVTAMMCAPLPTNGFSSNIVLCGYPRPMNADRSSIDTYLTGVIDVLQSTLMNPSLDAVWVSSADDDSVPQQRLMIRHEVEGFAVDLVQHHTWLDDLIVVITVSLAANPDAELIELLDRCLLSPSGFDGDPSTLPRFEEWISRPTAPPIERILHL